LRSFLETFWEEKLAKLKSAAEAEMSDKRGL
jgi:hypothetical protein